MGNYFKGKTTPTIFWTAWFGLKNSIDLDGTIHAIIGETGIKDKTDDYSPKSTKYMDAAPGLGAVLRAIAAVTKSDLGFWTKRKK